jgi:hypothetical protein
VAPPKVYGIPPLAMNILLWTVNKHSLRGLGYKKKNMLHTDFHIPGLLYFNFRKPEDGNDG